MPRLLRSEEEAKAWYEYVIEPALSRWIALKPSTDRHQAIVSPNNALAAIYYAKGTLVFWYPEVQNRVRQSSEPGQNDPATVAYESYAQAAVIDAKRSTSFAKGGPSSKSPEKNEPKSSIR